MGGNMYNLAGVQGPLVIWLSSYHRLDNQSSFAREEYDTPHQVNHTSSLASDLLVEWLAHPPQKCKGLIPTVTWEVHHNELWLIPHWLPSRVCLNHSWISLLYLKAVQSLQNNIFVYVLVSSVILQYFQIGPINTWPLSSCCKVSHDEHCSITMIY